MSAQAASLLVKNVLDETAVLVRTRMQRYLAERRGNQALYELAADYPERGGRMLRAGLCLASARAYGANDEAVLDTAVALELLHNAFLVHDDIEDGGEQRRGRPTLHRLYGVPVAVNVGDALSVLSLRPLIENRDVLGPYLSFRVLEETERMARESVEGQALELGWRQHNCLDVTDDDYLEMILKKTCWYTTIHPLRMGALIGSRGQADLNDLVRLGFFLGAAFQIQDDVLNLEGDERRYGKELDGDLYEGKRTLMLLHLLRSASPPERARLGRLLALPRSERSRTHVRWMRERMRAYGSIEYARQIAHGLAGAALSEYERVCVSLPPSREKCFLEALALWMLARA